MLLYLLTCVGVKANGLTLVIAGKSFPYMTSTLTFLMSFIRKCSLSLLSLGVICAFSLPLAYRLQQVGF